MSTMPKQDKVQNVKSASGATKPSRLLSAKSQVTPVTPVDKGIKRDCAFSPPSPEIEASVLSKMNEMIESRFQQWQLKIEDIKKDVNSEVSATVNLKMDEIEKAVSKNINDKFDKMSELVNTSKQDIVKEFVKITAPLEQKILLQDQEIKRLNVKLDNEMEKRLDMEAYSKRQNIKIFNIPESVNDGELETFVLEKFTALDINIVQSDIDAIHRIGTKTNKTPRPVIIRFTSFKAKSIVSKKRPELNQEGYRATDDLPIEWQKRRRILWPFVAAADKLKDTDEEVSAYIQKDKLIFDKKQYSVGDLDALPALFKPHNVYTPRNEETVLFFTKMSPFSNHYPASFSINDLQFNCSEQYIMYQKATLFGDKKLAQDIMHETNPVQQKVLGYSVKKFDNKAWRNKAKSLIKPGIKAKVLQNEIVQEFLVSTGDRRIGEASRNDNFFGIGMDMFATKAWDMNEWPKNGNLMGKILQEIRHEILTGEIPDEDN